MMVTEASIRITETEFQTRCEKLQKYLMKENLSGVVLFDQFYIHYFCGFVFIPTERPIAFVMNTKGEKALFVPRLEKEHASSNSSIDQVVHYEEYPGTKHPSEKLKTLLLALGIQQSFAADQDGYPWIFGYRGPSLNVLMGNAPKLISGFIEEQMMVKSAAELALIRESVKWANLAHTLLQRYTQVGATETEVSMRASAEATSHMMDAIGPLYRSLSAFSDGPSAGYRGQIGRNAAIPHALANNIIFQPGDVLVTGAGAPVWGYHSELERTMIIGKANDEQKRMFEHMLALQDLAISMLEPGIKCADADKVIRGYYDQNDLTPYWKHHVGHAIGLRYHEGPFLDIGDQTEILPGMVYTIEPGLYAPELGGFRHSDTVVITQEGVEVMTYYPRDLDSLTIPI